MFKNQFILVIFFVFTISLIINTSLIEANELTFQERKLKEIQKNESDKATHPVEKKRSTKTAATGNTIYVDVHNDSGQEEGTEKYPFRSIKYAVDNSSDGDIIIVKQGTYYETEEIEIHNNITLYGNGSILIGPGVNSNENCFVISWGSYDVTITNFIITNWETPIFVFSTGEGEHKIINNILVANGGSAIPVFDNCSILNNIICFNDGFGISYFEGQMNNYYNNIYNNSLDNWYDCSPSKGSLSVDPLFKDVDNFDFQLSTGSPCIDAGFPTSFYIDRDGSINDMGAFGGPYYNSLVYDYLPSFKHFKPNMPNTSNNATVIITQEHCPTIHGNFISIGDEIGVFTPREKCAGFGLWLEDNLYITIWGDDPDKYGSLGFLIGESFSFKLWDDSEQAEFGADVKYFTGESGYEKDVIVILESLWVGIYISVDKSQERQKVFSLYQNNPNPFNPTTTISFSLPSTEPVNLKIYDSTGKLVTTLIDNSVSAGVHNVDWNARDFSSGIYLYRIEAGEFVETKKMLLIK